jgi:hypothetical protein
MASTKNSDGDVLAALKGAPVRSVEMDLALKLPEEKVAGLVNSLDLNLVAKGAPILHFVSAYQGEDAGRIALETAYAEAVIGKKRVLFLDCCFGRGADATLAGQVEVAFDQFLTHGREAKGSPFVMVEGTSFFYTRLSDEGNAKRLGFSGTFARALSACFKDMFDLVIIVSEGGVSSGHIPTFSKVADGSVVVAQAERTRGPVVKELVAMIEANGGHAVGSVLSGRKYYIPRILYKLLFRA